MLIFHGYVTLAEANYFRDLTNERSWDSCNQQSPCEDGDPSTTGLGTNTHGFEHDLPIKHGNGKSPFSTYLGFNVVFFFLKTKEFQRHHVWLLPSLGPWAFRWSCVSVGKH